MADRRMFLKSLAGATAGLSLAGSAMAANDWSTEIVTTITGTVATVSAIGLAVLTLYVTAKVFKWVKTAM